ncbi:hypothetical protein J2810_004635 [Chryseobacterium rhizosphaerae]|uniref:hypothetical protein n=1 Tax=Chryseobacterium rhizosphaerae TaxID=395937 RepID=UPI002856CEAC|nr:hypothetical protein [Chryseobacterium rhizosphaerae]MDR6548545.1 hypothetical protein [Chryseobacterium rhizosphaerae]
MAHKIIFNVSPKVFDVTECVRFTPNRSYEDIIQKDFDYTGQSQKAVSITNICSVPFTVSGFTLFSNTENGGNFEARVDSFSIGASQLIEIPVLYFGTCKSDLPEKNYLIALNGVSVNYKLIIETPFVNTPPEITTVEMILDNRESHVFGLQDFLPHYSDADNHNMASIILEGDLSAFRLNGNFMTSPAEVTALQLQNGAFEYLAQDTNDEINIIVTLKAKDELGATSN